MSEQKLITSRKLQRTKVKEKKLHPGKTQNLKFHMISFQKTLQRGHTTSHVHHITKLPPGWQGGDRVVTPASPHQEAELLLTRDASTAELWLLGDIWSFEAESSSSATTVRLALSLGAKRRRSERLYKEENHRETAHLHFLGLFLAADEFSSWLLHFVPGNEQCSPLMCF